LEWKRPARKADNFIAICEPVNVGVSTSHYFKCLHGPLQGQLHLKAVSAIRTHGRRFINYKQTPWPLDRMRTIPTERPPLVDEI
jgi:hypothetical protein